MYNVQVGVMDLGEIAKMLVVAGEGGSITVLLELWAHVVFWRALSYQRRG